MINKYEIKVSEKKHYAFKVEERSEQIHSEVRVNLDIHSIIVTI